jgi:hypothetical protein
VSTEQRQLREATQRYVESLPPLHRELLQLMAADYSRPPYAVVAGAIEEAIARWRADYLAKGAGREARRTRLA